MKKYVDLFTPDYERENSSKKCVLFQVCHYNFTTCRYFICIANWSTVINQGTTQCRLISF